MSAKGKTTTTTYLEWEVFKSFLAALEKAGEYKFLLLFALGGYTGLRISDILSLRWYMLHPNLRLTLTESKTKKPRAITIHKDLHTIIDNVKEFEDPEDFGQYIFCSRHGDNPMSVQYINRKMKVLCFRNGISVPDDKNISTHLLRKTFGRRVWDNQGQDEKALIMLMEVFNHSSVGITKRYLGIRSEEIEDIYKNL
jgi:integrase